LNVVQKPATAINYASDKITINESYDIIDVATMVAFIVENRPVGGYTAQPSFGQGDAILTVNK